MSEQVIIRVINNLGDCFNEEKAFPKGTTVMDLFKLYAGEDAKPTDVIIRINAARPESPDYIMQNGDRFSIIANRIVP